MLFSGEVAWVTGSSKGIGRAVGIGLAESGCDVVALAERRQRRRTDKRSPKG